MREPVSSREEKSRQRLGKSRGRADSARANTMILRFAYIGTLSQLPPEKVREFWSEHSGLTRLYPDERVMYETLWQGDSWIDLSVLIDTIGALENYLGSRGINNSDFIYKTITNVTCGSLVPPRVVLLWCKPILAQLGSTNCSHESFFDVFECVARSISPNLLHRRIARQNNGENKSAVFLLMKTGAYASDKNRYAASLEPFDCESWVTKPAQVYPMAFNLPCFLKSSMICDARSCDSILEADRCSIRSGKMYINDKPYAILEMFHSFCNRNGYDIADYAIEDRPVVVMENDYICPKRNRVVLYKNCAYGAPVFLYSLTYGIMRRSVNLLSSLIDLAFGERECVRLKQIEMIHKGMIARMDGGVEFVYSSRTESMSVNGVHAVRYTPAKILRKIILLHLRNNQTIFSYGDFVNDGEIILDPLKPNLNIRLKRLFNAIQRCCPRVKFRKKGRGTFEFKSDVAIKYREQ